MGEPARQLEGAVLSRRYRVEAAIAAGGWGTVYRASHLALGHDVALKVLHERALSDDALRRFAREAKIAAQLGEASRNVARVIDFGVDTGRPFLVMELLRGEDLRERLDREPRLPPALVVEITRQLCAGLDAAHELGVVHRDIKPANVFLARAGTPKRPELVVKLMDFGVATLCAETTMRNGMVLGTPAFMSPEQIQGQTTDARADLWSVAALVYRMLTGVTPFGNGPVPELGPRIVDAAPDPPTSRVPELPPAIDGWMARALAKDPNQRFASALELALGLEDALSPRHPALASTRSGVRAKHVAPRPWLLPVLAALTCSLLLVVLYLFR